jgi:hypothetical protein
VVVPRLEVAAVWGVAAEPRQAARDAVVVLRQEVAAWDAEPQQEVAAWDAAAERQQEAAARVGAAVPQQAAEQAGVEAAVRQRAARGAAAPRRAAPDVRAALPSAVPWVFRRGQHPPWPAPPPAAQLARAMERARIATP